MPFLAINGVEFPVADGHASEAVREIGNRDFAFDGSIRSTRSASKRDLSVQGSPVVLSEAVAWDGLIRGLGEFWSFDATLYGSKGLGPSSTSGASISATGALFGSKLAITNGGSVVYPTGFTGNWTIIVWRNASAVAGSGNWTHYIRTSDGVTYNNGVVGGSTTWLGMSSGTLSLSGDGATRWYDELVALPYVIPSAWAAQIYNLWNAGRTWSALPTIHLSGNAVPDSARRSCVGAVKSADMVQGYSGGSWQIMRQLSADFQEA